MKKSYRKQLLSVLILSGAVFISGSSFAAENLSMDAKLKKCETAFDMAHSGKLTQSEARKAREDHIKLTLEILADLNKRNAEVSTATSEVLSDQEILNNFKVMGRLLEMLAKDHPAQTDEFGYPLY